jgi:hypothetical protein
VSLDKLTIGVYDLLEYLLPGYVVLIAYSLVESTFVGTWFLSLGLLSTHAVVLLPWPT